MKTCSIEGCRRQHLGKGFCQLHLNRFRNGLPLTAPLRYNKGGPTCSIPGCKRATYSKGMCGAHYCKARKGQDLSAPLRYTQPEVCSTPGCGRLTHARGLCASHGKGDPTRVLRVVDPTRPCKVIGCVLPHNRGGFCRKHGHLSRREVTSAIQLASRLGLRRLDLDQETKTLKDLVGVCAPRGSFNGAVVEGTLSGYFSRATFTAAHIRGAVLSGVFRDADFVGCDLTDADFTGADLRDAVFSSCTFKNTRFPKSPKLRGSVKLIQCEGEPIC